MARQHAYTAKRLEPIQFAVFNRESDAELYRHALKDRIPEPHVTEVERVQVSYREHPLYIWVVAAYARPSPELTGKELRETLGSVYRVRQSFGEEEGYVGGRRAKPNVA